MDHVTCKSATISDALILSKPDLSATGTKNKIYAKQKQHNEESSTSAKTTENVERTQIIIRRNVS